MKNRGGRKEVSSTDDHSLHRQGGGCCCLSVGADIGSSEEEEEGGGFTPVSHQVQQQQEGGRDYLLVIFCRLTVLQPTQTKDSVSVTRLLQTHSPWISSLTCTTCRSASPRSQIIQSKPNI